MKDLLWIIPEVPCGTEIIGFYYLLLFWEAKGTLADIPEIVPGRGPPPLSLGNASLV